MKQISKKLIGIVLLFLFTIPMAVQAGVIDATVNGMDGFQIEGDVKVWLDLDNPNILGKSYNEIETWADENGFRFAGEIDLSDLTTTVLPEGDFESDDISDESHYTYEEEAIIGRTTGTGETLISAGYSISGATPWEPLAGVKATELYRCSPELNYFCLNFVSNSINSNPDDYSYDLEREDYSAWLIYNGVPGSVSIGVSDITVDGMDGFRILNDDRLWLDLDNDNIINKSYNEIKTWADENGFRLATEADIIDLQEAVMPQGDIQGTLSSNEELHYTSDEIGIIGLTLEGYKNSSNSTIGYTLTDLNMPINFTIFFHGGAYAMYEPIQSTSANSILSDEYTSGVEIISGYSAWLIYNGTQSDEDEFQQAIIQGKTNPNFDISFTRELLGTSSTGGTTELIINGDFELNATGWESDQTMIFYDPGTAYAGNYSAFFSDYGSFKQIYQQITIPSNATTATLNLKYQYTDDTSGVGGYGGICILNAESMEVITCDYLDENYDTDGYWYNLTADISSLRNQRIYIVHFLNNEDTDSNAMVIDDASISVTLSDKVAIHQFYSATGESHYFTAEEEDKYKIFDNWLDYWTYVGVGWYGYATEQPGTIPVYHFYAVSTEAHYFTASEDEKNYIIATWPEHWEYIGVAWYGNSTQETGTKPVYQFYSNTGDSHYFTASEEEKDMIMELWPDYWTYIGIKWYGYTDLE